jgi:hypothetical protein
MGKVVIKQRSHPDNENLPAKYIGAIEYATPKVGKDGKVITGVDENAYAILNSDLPEKEKKKKQESIIKIRENLEHLLSIDLSVDSGFWQKFFIILDEDRPLDPKNALDQLHEIFLLANRYVAPSFEEMEENPDYMNCLFYIYREEEETIKKASTEFKKDKAISALVNLQESDPMKLKIVAGDIFGINAEDLTVEQAYVKLKEFLEAGDVKAQKENTTRFMDSASKTSEEMQIKKVLDKAIKKKIVTSKGNVYRNGEEIYGNNYEEALDFLNSPENSGELADLQKSVNRK